MRWNLLNPDAAVVEQLRTEAGLSPLMARLLVLRGITSAAEARPFLSPSLAQMHSPYLMRGMQEAVERIVAAIANREDILIYGDYDVDGTTAVVILKTAIELCGGTADFHVPHRIKEGYGLKDDVIERAAASGVRVVISVDTGIRAFQAAETARRIGVDLIVTDHHLPEAGEGVPQALAVLNPNQQGCEYPCKALCGAGVAFKLAQALFAKFKDETEQARLVPSFLKMVAIATIADAVPLTGENRVMAKLGLEGLRRPVNGGLKALMEVSGLVNAGRELNAGDVGFRLGPRINAAGRMDVARDVIEL
ncbi:MAG TPA: DHH family phosphoesterase, partial [Candidatus Angelobacter sp.]|nr:DHH family phosphoesterase [Candidatus Angelobacter sp.]